MPSLANHHLAHCPSLPGRLKLPPKRLFIHSHSVEFVEERREALDKYLRALLAHEELASELAALSWRDRGR